MATNTSRLLEEIKDIIQCAMCMEVMKEHRMLPCAHSFCLSCLNQYCDTSDDDTAACPNCRKPFSIPADGVSCFPINYIINKLVDASAAPSNEKLEGIIQDLKDDKTQARSDQQLNRLDGSTPVYSRQMSTNNGSRRTVRPAPGPNVTLQGDLVTELIQRLRKEGRYQPVTESEELRQVRSRIRRGPPVPPKTTRRGVVTGVRQAGVDNSGSVQNRRLHAGQNATNTEISLIDRVKQTLVVVLPVCGVLLVAMWFHSH